MSDPEQSWQKLVEAARKAPPTSESMPPDPSRFATRVIAMRDAIATFARALAWRRWSVITALLCAAALIAVFAATRCSGESRPLIEPPAHPIPHR